MIDYFVSSLFSKDQRVRHRYKIEFHMIVRESIQAKGSWLAPSHVRVTSASGGMAKYDNLGLAVVVKFIVW
jgi:hypothetical protein